ncbi:MAG: lamin tail domain-containing protein [Planctomycetota bacterium]|nr:lamin tail domain-containing protein [Planctomycetota bacterium]
MDHIYKLYFNGGPLTPDVAKARYQVLSDMIDGAIVAESARWGDMAREPPLARNTDWAPRRDWELNTYFPTRSGVELNNLRNAGMYPLLAANAEAPDFSQNGGAIQPGFQLVISNPNAAGTIYYTADGSDPRLPGGGISGNALIYSGAITLNDSRMVRARVKNGALWSAVHDAVFLIPTPPSLRITELMYNPAVPPVGSSYGAQDFEFIELKNIGAAPLNLGGLQFTNGVDFTFPDMTLPAGGYTVVVASELAFRSRYGDAIPLAGQWLNSNLNNGGERIELAGKFGEPILDFSYSPAWYPASNGEGFSLSLLDPLADRATWGDKESWWLSQNVGGTPGADNVGMAPHSVVINELLAHTDADPRRDWVELKNVSGGPINVSGWYLSNDINNLRKYRIGSVPPIPAGQFLLLTERDNFGNPADPGYRNPIGFGEYGGTVYLTAADAGDNLLGYREVQEFDDSDREVAFTRYVKSNGKSDFVAENSPTPGVENAYPKIGPIVLSEVMYHPADDADEFVELQNITGAAVPLYDPDYPANTWHVTGGVSYTFATGLSIPAGGYLLLVNTDAAAFRAKYGVPAEVQVLGPYTGRLNNAGETIRLQRPGEPDPEPPHQVPYYLVDRVEYHPVAPWPVQADGFGPSLQRSVAAAYGNDVANWYAGPNEGTPGRTNGSTDVTPPRLETVKTTDGIPNSCHVTFNEAIDPISSHNALNYVLDNGVTVTGVSDGLNNRSVVLTTTNLSEGVLYTLSINHVQNAAGIEIAADTQVAFNYNDSGKGLKAQYFNWTDQGNMFDPANLRLTRIDPSVNFHWDGATPVAPGVASSSLAVRWTGSVKPAYSETYTFYTVTDDGVSLWVNSQQLINDPTSHGDQEFSGSISLVAGQNYDIRMDFFQGGGPATAILMWSSSSTSKQIIPTKNLYDTSRPTVSSAKAQDAATVAVVFTEEMDRDSVQDLVNYQVTYPVNQPVTVTGAAMLPDQKTVWLTLATPMTQGTTYTVAVANVLGKSGHQIRPGAFGAFTYIGPAAQGNVLREWWLGIGTGNAVSDLTNNPNFPNNPSGSDYPTSFEAPRDWADGYGTRMRAYVTAPATGDYVFWIASDDNSELWLSTNDDPATKRRIAYVSGWTGPREWTIEANQSSASAYGIITLQAGQRYYIEALQKEGGGGDNLCVRWQLPNLTIEEPIPGSRLTAYAATPTNTVSIVATDPNASEAGPDKGTFTITRTGSTAQALAVYYTVTGTARTDDMQQYLTGTALIPAGAPQVTVDVMPVNDTRIEPSETVILTLVPDRTYAVGEPAAATVTIVDNDLPDLSEVAAITFGNPHARGVSEIVSGVLGVHVITVTFSQPMTFAADDVLVQKVTFSGNTETVTGTLLPSSVDGTGTKTMTINLAAGSAVDTWAKVTLKGNGTLKDLQGNLLDGEPKAGGSGRTYVYNAATDLPTGNGTPGGSTVFYLGSLRGDFASVGGVQTPDGQITPEDIDGFMAQFGAADLDADFRGAGFGAAAPDGLVTPADIDGFLSAYQAAAAVDVRLSALPNPGPLGEGEPGPLAAGSPEPVVPVLGDAPTPPAPDVDALAMASEVGAGAASPESVNGGVLSTAAPAAATAAPIAPPSEDLGAGLTLEPVLAAGVPLASSASGAASAASADPVLEPDGGVDLLALAALEVPLW